MTDQETVTITRLEYEALLDRNGQLEDALAAMEADDGVRVPHEVAVAVINGERPMAAYRKRLGATLQDLSERTGLAVSYLSEIERGRKAGSAAALARIASALGTTIDLLVSD